MDFGKGITNYGLSLDFNPIIKEFKLTGKFVLQHWQAMPKGFRNFGYLEVDYDKSIYRTIVFNNIIINVPPIPLQVNERIIKSVPTAVNYFPESSLTFYPNVPIWRLSNAES